MLNKYINNLQMGHFPWQTVGLPEGYFIGENPLSTLEVPEPPLHPQ